MSWPGTPAFRMRYAAAASPPNPPPTIWAFICLLPGFRVWEVLPTRVRSSKQQVVNLAKRGHIVGGHLNNASGSHLIQESIWDSVTHAVVRVWGCELASLERQSRRSCSSRRGRGGSKHPLEARLASADRPSVGGGPRHQRDRAPDRGVEDPRLALAGALHSGGR